MTWVDPEMEKAALQQTHSKDSAMEEADGSNSDGPPLSASRVLPRVAKLLRLQALAMG